MTDGEMLGRVLGFLEGLRISTGPSVTEAIDDQIAEVEEHFKAVSENKDKTVDKD